MAVYIASRALAQQFATEFDPDILYSVPQLVLQNILNNLTIFILGTPPYSWREKVLRAGQEGAKHTTIYTYLASTLFQGYPVIQLINGPPGDPNFFQRGGYTTVIQQLETAVTPGIITNWPSYRPCGSIIDLEWT